MSRPAPRPPVILIGMHRSGTTLLAEVLGELGLFLGWRLAANHEASSFNKLNRWLLASSGGRWDTPESIDYLLADAAGRELAARYLRDRLASLPALEFLGPARFRRCRSLFALAEPWGWKDPRTTATLPVWLDLFPDARVIHVVRHGVDVAESLRRRQLAGQELGRRNLERHRTLLRLLAKQGWFGTSPRVLDRRQGVQLWERYLDFAERFTAGLGERLLEVRYETFLARPRREAARILDFCGLTPPAAALDAALASVRAGRAFAFRRDPELVALWEEVRESPWMVRYGYDAPEPDRPRSESGGEG